MSDWAELEEIITRGRCALLPPPKLSLSEWADRYFQLSASTAAEPGQWHTLPYQREMMDAITDPTVTYVTVMKSARVGYTLMASAAIAYYIHQAPANILVVQPTVEDAKGFSKETIAPMLRDVPALASIAFKDIADSAGVKDSSNTILSKEFNGYILSMVGANSGTGFRRVSRKVVIFDEVDAYPASAGSDGDPIKLGVKRSEYYWDRKIISGSTPLIADHSRIETLFLEGDQRRYYVPCPQCGHMDHLVFREPDTDKGEHGHWMQWPEDEPEKAYFVCFANGCVIEHSDKRSMIERGKWIAAAPFKGHVSFHISALYSYSPNSSWADIATEFLKVKSNPETLRVFLNTVLGETWKERGDAPDWERLYQRREHYQLGSVPEGVMFLTCGVDVQKDRLVWEVVGWGPSKESWSVDSGELFGSTENEATWLQLDELLNRPFVRENGETLGIAMLAVDSGFNTQMVYNWARRYPMSRVIAVKGSSTAKTLVGTASAVELTLKGKKISRGYKYFPVGVDIAKAELYGWLRLPTPIDGQPFPAGYCHFPHHDPEYFKQLTAEELVSVKNNHGYSVLEWHQISGRQNHRLDARVYARAAAFVLGIDRLRPPTPTEAKPSPPPLVVPPKPNPTQPAAPARPITDSSFFKSRGKSWFGK